MDLRAEQGLNMLNTKRQLKDQLKETPYSTRFYVSFSLAPRSESTYYILTSNVL